MNPMNTHGPSGSAFRTQHTALVLVRRFAVLAVLMFWQGGFTFYAAIVVPVGTEVLGSKVEQGRITRQVARSINLSGAVALAVFAVDIALTGRGLRWGRWLTWLAMALALGVLFVLHERLDAMFIPDELKIVDRPTFRLWHRTYLWVSTVQWGFAAVFAVLTLAGWRREDRGALGA
jgi:hypothetical protein